MDRVQPFKKPEQLESFWREPSAIHEKDAVHSTASTDRKEVKRSTSNEYVKLSASANSNLNAIPTVMVSRADDDIVHTATKHEFQRSHQLRRSCPPPSRPNRRRSKTPSAYSQRSIVLKPAAPTVKSSSVLSVPNTLVERMQSKINSVRKSWFFSLFQPDGTTRSLGKSKQSKWTKADIDFETEFFDRQNELTESLISRRSPLSMGSSTGGSISALSSAPQSPTDKDAGSVRLSPLIDNPSTDDQRIVNAYAVQDADCRQDNILVCDEQLPQQKQSKQQRQPSPQQQQQQNPQQTNQQQSQQQQQQQQEEHGRASSHSERQCNAPSVGQVQVTEQCVDSDHPHNHYRKNGQHHPGNSGGQCYGCNPSTDSTGTSTVDDTVCQTPLIITDYHHCQRKHPAKQKSCDDSSISLSSATPTAIGISTLNTDSDDLQNNNLLSSDCQPIVLRRNQLSVPSSSICVQRRNRPQSACLDTYMLRMRNGNLLQFTVDEENKDEECCSIIPSVSDYESSVVGCTQTLDSVASNGRRTERPLSIISNVINNECSLVNIPAAATMANIDGQRPQIIDLYWPRRRVSPVSVDSNQTALGLIRQAIRSNTSAEFFQSQWKDSVYIHSLALRLVCHTSNSNNHQWLHPTQNILQFFQLNHELIAKGWRLEIRIRYVPDNLNQLFHDDVVISQLLYQQVLADFLSLEFNSDTANEHLETIVELGCLELRSNNPYLTPQTLEKSSNFDSLENDLHFYFPSTFINSIKTKVLRKLIKREFKKIHALTKPTAIFEFLRLVPKFVDFQKEKFHCSFGESAWSIPIDLIVDAKGITTSAHKAPLLKEYDRIQKIQIQSHATLNRASVYGAPVAGENENVSSSLSKKILVSIQIRDENDMLVISCSSFAMAQSLADLLDGYRRLALNTDQSVWINVCENNPKSVSSSNSDINNKDKVKIKENDGSTRGQSTAERIEAGKTEVGFVTPKISSAIYQSYGTNERKPAERKESLFGDEEGDYSSPDEFYRELNRKSLHVGETIGSGQFGDVYKGVYYCEEPSSSANNHNNNNNNSSLPSGDCIEVAIKISKIGNSTNTRSSFEYFSADQKLLCEAQRMRNLEHPNVIRMIGVCSDSPVYVVMELAKYGELRDFLQKHGGTLEHRYLIDYCYQISSALSYLEMKQFVHRDIAARNVLVYSFDCVKLADFGLSRYIEDASYYMATNSKLPIKWMAPESINFRRFTSASDVWMFAVCMWEIFMLGKKPFIGVKNVEVIGLIETGERLARPTRCPEALYELMLKCWKYEPDKRPTFRYIRKSIHKVQQNELGLVGAIARADQSSRESTMSTVSSTNHHHSSASSSLSSSNVDMKKSDVAFSRSSRTAAANAMDVNKIKAILEEQRRQMQEDSKWLAQNETNWSKGSSQYDSYKSGKSEIASSSSVSVYEDAPALKSETVYLTPSNLNQSAGNSYGEASCNSFKSLVSEDAHNNSNTASIATTTSSSGDSNTDTGSNCNLSVSLKKFFKQNKLVDRNMREEMMSHVNCTSANIDRSNDIIYQGTIQVVNSVRSMVKGVRQLNSAEIVDLVKEVGLHLRNLMANIDCALLEMPADCRENIENEQKKVTANMNSIVDAMKKTIINADSPMKEHYMQNMLEAAYILIIDTKNLFDLFDDVQIEMKSLEQANEQLTSAFGDIDDVCDNNSLLDGDDSQQIYENEDVSSESTTITVDPGNILTHSVYPSQTTTFHVPANNKTVQ